MLIVTSRHVPDMGVVETIEFENPVQACFIPCNPEVVYVIEDDHPMRNEALSRDQLIEALRIAS